MASLAPEIETVPVLDPKPGARALLWAIGAFVVIALAWAWFSRIDTITRGMGRVIPSTELQRVAHLEGGIVKEIVVRNGQRVRKGDLLLRLDPTSSAAERDRGVVGEAAAAARIARLEAEIAGRPPRFPAELAASSPELVGAERALYLARETQLSAETSAARARLEQAEKGLSEARAGLAARLEALDYARRETAMVQPMVEKGVEPMASLLRTQGDQARADGDVRVAEQTVKRATASVSEARSALRSVGERYRSESADALARTRAEASNVGAQMPALADRLARTELRAPVSGIVNRVLVNTVGGVARPGEPLVEIVPADDQLEVDARIKPSDIGFIRAHQPASVKLTAYDYAVYGSLQGRVERISPDAVAEERTGELYYLVRVRTDGVLRDAAGKPLPIVPGMIAEVDILGNKRRVIDYILTPVERVKDTAFRER